MAGPDRTAALAQYRQRAGVYDLELMPFEPVRRLAVGLLDLRPGQVVLDIGCGTGLSLPLLVSAVGRSGRALGIDQSPEMIERALARVESAAWQNVTLIGAPVEVAEIPIAADAALFHFTHDVLQQPQALANVIGHLKPGARVVATGLKWAPPWQAWANLFVLPAALRSVSSLAGLDSPWRGLSSRLRNLQVQTLLAGSIYVARGEVV